MVSDDEKAELRRELRSLEATIQRIRAEFRDMGDDLREPDEGPVAGRMAVEQQALLASLESRRDALRRRLGQRTSNDDGDAPPSIDDDSGSVTHKGRGEDIGPAVWPEEWTSRGGDQLSGAADVDDPVEALEVGALGAGAEASPSDDTTELADRAAPAPPEEAALTARVGSSPASDDLTVGLPPGADLDRLEEATLDDLIEAELVAIDAGDPESAVIIAAELERRRTRS